jgi:L-asparaginase
MSSEKVKCMSQKIVILGTGGTIAGLSLTPGAGGAYRAAQVGIAELLTQSQADGAHAGVDVSNGPADTNGFAHTAQRVSEQIAQIDSKDMDESVWQRLLARIDQLQQDPEVQAVVITHGTDTLEETGFLLQACWPRSKPIVLTCAMKPADAPDADGPGNLRHAIALAGSPGLHGVYMVCAGEVFEGHAFQKLMTEGVQPFRSQLRDGADARYPELDPPELQRVLQARHWPRVEIVFNHAGANGDLVKALLASSTACAPAPAGVTGEPLFGIVLAGTGQGTYSDALGQALKQAQAQGVRVHRSTRALLGAVQPRDDEVFVSVPWTPVKARVAMMLDGLCGRQDQDVKLRKPAP